MDIEWANPSDPKFLLVPPAFEVHAVAIYDEMGQPAITSNNFWEVYLEMLALFRVLPDDPDLTESLRHLQDEDAKEMELLSNLQDLPDHDDRWRTQRRVSLGDASHEIGAEGLGEFAYFTPSEDDDDES
jgi:hypothetical protein